jgi:ankyrin repeat protein
MQRALLFFSGMLSLLHQASCKKQDPAEEATAELRDTPVMERKLDAGLSVQSEDEHGKPLLNQAAAAGSLETVQLLIRRGVDVNRRSKLTGKTALYEAAYIGNVPVAQALLDAGTDPNAQDDSGERPLREAALSKNPEMVRLLLSRGADPKAKNKKGLSVIAVVAKQATPEILKLLGTE